MHLGATRIVLLVIGMRSNSCRERVAESLKRTKGVKDVSVSLIRARAVVVCEPPCCAEDLIHAISKAGYGAVIGEA